MEVIDLIVKTPTIRGGRPCLRGTGLCVTDIVMAHLFHKRTPDEVASDNEMTFKIKGLDCAGCAQSVERGVGQLEGVQGCSLNFTSEILHIQGDCSRQAVVERVQGLGFEAVDADETVFRDEGTEQEQIDRSSLAFLKFIMQRTETRLALLAFVCILPGLILEELGQWSHPLIDFASLTAMSLAGWPIARSAWRTLRLNREVNINGLMTIAAIGAVVIGAYTEAGMVMVLFALGEALEGYTSHRARQAIRSLMDVVPQQATRLGRSGEEVVSVAALDVGDIIVVKPGERIPMDGLVRQGISTVNQATITGESQPLEKAPGAEVFASSINGEGVLEIEVTHLVADNTISRLIKLVEKAQENQAPSQRFIDQFAKYYTPLVVGLAFLVATLPPLLGDQPFWNPDPETFGWFYRGLTLLVVACPCALVISTPVSLISAISNAARQGVLIKGGAYLERLSRVKVMAFDKTGTLTTGKPRIVALRSAGCETIRESPIGTCAACHDLLALTSALERHSEHPLAHAIIQEATHRSIQDKYPVARGVKAMAGRGIVGQVNGQQVSVGSHAYFDQTIPHTIDVCQTAQAEAQEGYTPLMVETDGAYLGTITVSDTVRESSHQALTQLKQAGVDHLVMLTGDHQVAAKTIAKEIGLTDVRADLLPEQKVRAVQEVQRQYGAVAMVGDGINDTPALARADVSIAMGGALGGTAQAMETANITLMRDDLSQLAFVYRLSQAAMRTVRTNVGLSLGIKLIFLLFVLFGWGSMWMAVVADVGTSLLVTLNGMRLIKFQ